MEGPTLRSNANNWLRGSVLYMPSTIELFLFGFINNNICHPFYNNIKLMSFREKRLNCFSCGLERWHEDLDTYSLKAIGNRSDVTDWNWEIIYTTKQIHSNKSQTMQKHFSIPRLFCTWRSLKNQLVCAK